MILPALALLLLDFTGPPGPHPRRDVIHTVATVHAVALVASERCPNILVNMDANQLGDALGLADADKAWCDDVYARFGPEGTMMRGLLKR